MVVLLDQTINLVATSNADNILSSDGSSFQLELQKPLMLPSNAQNVHVSVLDAQIWYTVPNIILNKNDHFYITAPGTDNMVRSYTLVVKQGLYSQQDLSLALTRDMINQGIMPGVLELSADPATNRSVLIFNHMSVSVDFTHSMSMYQLLGYNPQIYGPFLSVPHALLGDYTAEYNTVNTLLLHSDLVANGIMTNNTYTQCVAVVPINAVPNSQILYSPFHPARISTPELAGARKDVIKFWLTNENLELVNTGSEAYSLRILLHYQIPTLF